MARFILTWLIVLAAVTSTAQDNTPPVIDPATIFGDGVTVLETLPAITFDNDARELYYFRPDANTWEVFPYPDEIEPLDKIQLTPFADGSYLLAQEGQLLFAHSELATPDSIWVFHPDRGIYHPSDDTTFCGVVPISDVMTVNGTTWVVDEENQRLCDMVTRRISPPLPEEHRFTASRELSNSLERIATANSDRYVFVDGYVYDIEQETFFRLDIPETIMEAPYWVEVDRNLLILGLTARRRDGRFFYVVNLDTRTELINVVGSYVGYPYQYIDDQFIYGLYADEVISIYHYDVSTNTTNVVYQMPCAMWDSEPCEPSGIIHYSEDDLLLFKTLVYGEYWGYGYIHAVDLTTNNLMFTIYALDIEWRDSGYLVVFFTEGTFSGYTFELSNDGYQVTITEGWDSDPSRLVDADYILEIDRGSQGIYDAHILDARTQAEVALIEISDFPDNYRMDWNWQDDNTLIVSAYKMSCFCGSFARWHIQVDALVETND